MPDGPVGERADHGVTTASGTSTKKVHIDTNKDRLMLRQACAT